MLLAFAAWPAALRASTALPESLPPGTHRWDRAGSPYLLQDRLLIGGETAVLIEAGVEILAPDGGTIELAGELRADGTADLPVTLRAAAPGAGWGPLLVLPGGRLHLAGTRVADIRAGTARGAITGTQAHITVVGCAFTGIPDTVIWTQESEVALEQSRFVGTGECINVVRSVARIASNVFRDVLPGGDAVDIDYDAEYAPPDATSIASNFLYRVAGDGIDLGSASPHVEGNVILQCQDKGISIGEASHPQVLNNLIAWCNVGIAVKDSSDPLMAFNLVHGCRVGLDAYEKNPGYQGGLGRFLTGILSENQTQLRCDDVSLPDVQNSLVFPPAPVLDAPSIISASPRFVAPERGDLRLAPDSPAIDQARPHRDLVEPAADLVGGPRRRGSAPDLGPIEAPAAPFDLDRDGLDDDRDPFPLDPDARQDSDTDGLPDEWEVQHWGTLERGGDADGDGDGLSDRAEWLAGLDPTDPGDATLRINEIHYHPDDDEPATEFVELLNTGSQPARLDGYRLADAVDFVFPPNTLLAAGGILVVALDPLELGLHHGIPRPLGPLGGPLPDERATVVLLSRDSAIVDMVFYDVAPPWPAGADGDGPSLEREPGSPAFAPPDAWAAARVRGGTPGRPNSAIEPAVVLNELFAAPAASAEEDWIELYNPGPTAFALGGCALTDDPRRFPVFVIPAGAELGPGEFAVLWRHEFGFGLDRGGEYLALLAADRRTVLSELTFPEQRRGAAYGRVPDGGAQWQGLPEPTPREPNLPPPPPPAVVLAEVHYHSAGDSEALEFVELLNLEPAAVDLAGWHFSDGFSFAFPDDPPFLLQPGGRVVIAHDRAALIEHDPLAPPEAIVGPFSGGRLSNRGERLVLADAWGNPVSTLQYQDRGRWPRTADGEGPSLEWIGTAADQTGPRFWRASLDSGGSPGRVGPGAAAHSPLLVRAVRHRPVVPRPGEPIEIAARLWDDPPHIADAAIRYRTLPSAPFETMPLSLRSPALAVWTAELPALPDNTLVEWYIDARGPDMPAGGGVHPDRAPGYPSPETGAPLSATLLCFVDAEQPAGPLGSLHLLITPRNWLELNFTRSIWSDALLDCTLIVGQDVFYGCGIRFRGTQKRLKPIKSYRVELGDAHPLARNARLNINGWNPNGEALATLAFSQAGFATVHVQDVTLWRNGAPLGEGGHFLLMERPGNAMWDRYRPGGAGGQYWEGWAAELVPGCAPPDPCVTHPEPIAAALAALADPTTYFTELPRRIDIDQWLRWFAATVLVADDETLLNLVGSNHFTYEPGPGTPLELHPLDLDACWSHARANIHPLLPPSPEVRDPTPGLDKFLLTPVYRRAYYQAIADLVVATPGFEEELLGDYFTTRGLGTDQWFRALRFLQLRIAYLRERLGAYIAGWPADDTPAPGPVDFTFAPAVVSPPGAYLITERPAVSIRGTVVPGTAAVRADGADQGVALDRDAGQWEWQGRLAQPGTNEIAFVALPLDGAFSPPSPAATVTILYLPGDTDGDGVPDAVELRLGTDPHDPAATPLRILDSSLDAGGASLTLRFQGWTDALFQIEWSADLALWQPLDPPRLVRCASDDPVSLTVPVGPAPRAFYRVVLVE